MRAAVIVVAVLLVGCGDDDESTTPASVAISDVDRCLEAAVVLGDLQPATNLRELQDAATLVAAIVSIADVDDEQLAAALDDLDIAATDMVQAAREGEQAAVERAARAAAEAYAAIDAAAQGMETGECRKESWGSSITNIPG